MNANDNRFSLLGIVIWLLVACFFLYEFFLRTFVGSLAYQIIPDLNLSVQSFAVIGSGYYFTYGIMQIPVGIMADRFGVKTILVFATLVCAGATFLFAHAHEFLTAFISRVIMGFGSSFAFVSLLVVAMNWFPKRYFSLMIGMSQFVGTLGPLLAGGPLVILMLQAHGNWRAPLSIVAMAGILLAFLIFMVVRHQSPVNQSGKLIFLSKRISLSESLKKLFYNQQVWYIAAYSGCSYASIALLGAVWGTSYLQAHHFTQSMAAFLVSLAWIGYALGCPFVGFISDLTKRRKPGLIACAVLGCIVTLFITYLSASSAWVYGILFVMLGFAASGQNIGFAAIAEHVAPDVRSTALGLNNGMITVFDTFLPIAVGFIIYHTIKGTASITQLQPENFRLGFSLMPAFYIIAIFIALFFIQETYCKPQHEIIYLQFNS